MRRIGLLGGMSFEGSASYYRHINEAVRARLGGQSSADILLRSVNFEDIVQLQLAARWDDAGRYLAEAARGLEDGGADCVLMCCVTMHIVSDAIENGLSVPFINIIDVTADRLKSAGRRRPLLIATRYSMEDGFYQAQAARHGIDVVVPDDKGRAAIHDIIFNELCQGKVLDRSRTALIELIEAAKTAGADSVILGCTEIGLILDPSDLPLPGFDSAAIHADAAVAFALGDSAMRGGD